MSRIWIIDDEPEIAEALKAVLGLQGYEVALAEIEDGNFFQRLKQSDPKPDLILLDILLSGQDGRTLCRELKNDPATRAIPVIMFSAYPNAALSAREAGAEAFLSKPFSAKELLTAIKKCLPKN